MCRLSRMCDYSASGNHSGRTTYSGLPNLSSDPRTPWRASTLRPWRCTSKLRSHLRTRWRLFDGTRISRGKQYTTPSKQRTLDIGAYFQTTHASNTMGVMVHVHHQASCGSSFFSMYMYRTPWVWLSSTALITDRPSSPTQDDGKISTAFSDEIIQNSPGIAYRAMMPSTVVLPT